MARGVVDHLKAHLWGKSLSVQQGCLRPGPCIVSGQPENGCLPAQGNGDSAAYTP